MIKITIYVDIIFLENIIMNMAILYATSILLKEKARFFRIVIASAIGSIYVIISYISNLKIYSSIILKIILSVIIVYVAFNATKAKVLLNQTLIFYLTSFVFGGVALYLIYFIKPEEITMINGNFSGTYPIKVIFLGAVVAISIIMISIKIIKTKITKKDMFYDITIKLEGREVKTKAMVDTGNLLKEPITNTPVVIVEYSILYDILPKEILNNLDEILGGDLEKIPKEIREQYLTKLKFIPFSSLGKQNGMLIGIKAEELEIKNENEVQKINKVIIGIYNKSLTKKGEYRALLGLELIEA